MIFGEKIRKYRTMRGLTQKELGQKIGFSAATADSRIRKYESGQMIPREELFTKLVEALDVDPSAISYAEVITLEDYVRTLFELEEEYGLRVECTEDTTSLIFNNSNPKASELISDLTFWQQEQKEVLKPKHLDSEVVSYENWKAHFPQDIHAFYERQTRLIDDYYHDLKEQSKKGFAPPKKVSEFILLLKSMLENGIDMDFVYDFIFRNQRGTYLEIAFMTRQLLSLSDKNKQLFATYLNVLDYFQSLGLRMNVYLKQNGAGTFICYQLYTRNLGGVIHSTMVQLKAHLEGADDPNDYVLMRFEDKFERDLHLYDLDIEEEIRLSIPPEKRKK